MVSQNEKITMNIKMIGLSSKIIIVLNNKSKQRLFQKYTKIEISILYLF